MEEKVIKSGKIRSEALDIAKGIGIILVVLGHAGVPNNTYIYQFHMPFFLLLSGFLFNTVESPKFFIVKKLKSIYIPFVFWNLLTSGFWLYYNKWDIAQLVKHWILIILTLNKDGFFWGATWFMGALFVISVLYMILDYALREVKNREWILLGIFIVIGVAGFMFEFPYKVNRTMILSMFFAIGRLVKEYKKEFSKGNNWIMAVFSGVLYCVLASQNFANMAGNKYGNRFLFVCGALLASYACVYIACLIGKCKIGIIKKLFVYLGRRSMDIMIWHFIVFRSVIFIQLKMAHLSLRDVMYHYPTYDSTNGWWIVYTIVGIVGSLLIGSILRMGPWGSFLKKIHVV